MRHHAASDLPSIGYSLSLTQIGQLFVEAGIGRSRRRLAELCQNGTITAKKMHTTSGPTWFATEVSVIAAIQQIKSDEALAAAASGSMQLHATAGDSMRENSEPNQQELPPVPTPTSLQVTVREQAIACGSMQPQA